jgi:DNA polymerase-1
MLYQILKLLASPIRKVNQNIKFDWRKLQRLGFQVLNVSGDTMLAAACLYCEFPKNLGFLTSLYTDIPYFKDEGKEFDPSKYKREQLYLYNAKDCLATHQIYTQQQKEIDELGVRGVYQNLITILPIYKEMEENGLLVDDTERERLLCKYISLFQIHSLKLKKLVGRPINSLSAISVGKLVYEELEWEVVRGVKHSKISGKPSADEESLEILMWSSRCNSRTGRDILRTIIDCRKLHKCIEFLSLPTYPDGRHRCEFNLAGAETGRTTAGETTDYYLFYDKGKIKLGNMGHSFQTIGKHGFTVDEMTYGKDLRSIFVPSSGYSFVECDLSQAEARVDAVLARDFEILQVFDSPTGIHRLTGSWVFNCLPSEIKKNILVDGVDRYHISKTVRHAGERNMTPMRLMMMIAKPIAFCGEVLKTFHANQPNMRGVFHREIREQIQKERVLIAPNGRRRDFFGRINEETINQGISQLPQAIVTDYMKAALPKVRSEMGDKMRPLSEAHDGFLSEVRSGHEEEYGKCFKKHAEVGIDFRTCSLARDYELVIPMEVESSKTNWQEMEKLL